MSIGLADYIRFAGQMASGFRIRHEREFFRLRQADVMPQLGSLQSWRVLDLANGQLQPQYALLRAAGHRVYGIDLINQPQRNRTGKDALLVWQLFRQGHRCVAMSGRDKR